MIKAEITNKISYDFYSISLRKDGIVQVNIEPYYHVAVDDVKIIVRAAHELANYKKHIILILAGSNSIPTDDARAYLASIDCNPLAIAEAYVITSLAQKIIGNFYLNFNKPVIPTKIFNYEDEAVKWLNSQ